MAKKKIISDFSALKGKISFAEKQSCADKPVPKGKAVKDMKSDEDGALRVGQHVVLMESDLRGKIVRLGRTVGIELEDGLTIDATYGEFAVTSETEIASLRDTKVKVKKSERKIQNNKIVQPSADGTMTVDLHIEAIPGGRNIPKGQQLQFQMETFRSVINRNINRKGMKITFVHGIGDGILKAAIRRELDEVLALRCSYSVGDPAVTIVSIR